MAKENEDDRKKLEEASGGGDKKDWFEEGCLESRQVERRSAEGTGRIWPSLFRGLHWIKTELLFIGDFKNIIKAIFSDVEIK